MPDNLELSHKSSTFKKSERLYLNSSIENLFKKGDAIKIKPYKIIYKKNNLKNGLNRVLITVPKKVQPQAAKRNKIKRLIKEAYRKNKYILLSKEISTKQGLDIAIIYLSSDIPDYEETESKIILTLQRLINLTSK